MPPDRMILDGHRYPVVVSASLYGWLMHRVLGPLVKAGPGAWTQGGRIAYERLETLYARGRAVELAGQGRVVRLAKRDARTLMGLLETARAGGGLPVPPASSKSLLDRLAWQVGDLDRMPGAISERARSAGCLQLEGGALLVVERLPGGAR